MKHFYIIILTGFFSVNASRAQTLLFLSQLNSSCDTVLLQSHVQFPFGAPGTCPPLFSSSTYLNSDTLELSLYYNATGVWPMWTCTTIDTTNIVIPPSAKVLRATVFLYTNNTGIPDTSLAQVQSLLPLCPTGIEENIFPEAIQIYPNPATGNFTINFSNRINKAEITLYNLHGEKVKEETIVNTSEKDIQLKNISPGIYFVRISFLTGKGMDRTEVRKVVKY